MKICFPFLAQVHQAFHALPIALEIAIRHPDAEVHLASPDARLLDSIRQLAAAYAPDAPVIFDRLRIPPFVRAKVEKEGETAPKSLTLRWNLLYFRRFDAIVVPERTSLVLKRYLPRTRFIWTRHGAGDRAVGFEPEIGLFDFVLMAGSKVEDRLRGSGLIRDGHYATGVYAKFDLVRRLEREPLFANDRPTILYNPHFRPSLSSWPIWGLRVVDQLARSDRFNLIFAPHIRLFYPPTPEKYAHFAAYADLPNVRIDLGSMASADMTYTEAADLYLGDVSSQVAEFVTRPRPCIFLNAHHVEWREDPSYRFWELGPVIEDVARLESEINDALASHGAYRDPQLAYVEETFGPAAEPTAPKGADAIMAYLSSEGRQRRHRLFGR
jgi:hypothetical protein